MNLLAVLALLASGVQEPNPSITFETRAVFAEKALTELSKVAGVNLMVSPQTKEEVLIISVKAVPLNQLLEKIAHAASAEWQKEATGYRLIRSAKLLQDHERRHSELDAAKFASAQEKLRASFKDQGELTAEQARNLGIRLDAVIKDAKERKGRDVNYESQQQLGRSLPGGRLASAITLLLDPNVLASMDDPGKLVFSTSPNRMQKPLPRGAQALIERYAREREMIQSHLPQVDPSQVEGLTGDIWNVVHRSRLKDNRVAKVLVEARTWEFANNMMVTVFVANAAGKIIEQSYCSLPMNEEMGPPPAPPAKAPAGETPMEFSQPAKDLLDAFSVAMRGGGDPERFPELPASVKPYILEPENHTMSELACSDLLLGAAKAKGLNVVAAPTDIFGFFSCVMFAGGVPTANQFLERMRAPIFDMKLEEPQGWLVLRMNDPYAARRFRMNRALLGKLVRTGVANQKVNIDEMASFAVTTSDDFERMACLIYLMLASPKVGRDLESASWQALRFHGGLSVVQRQALESGEKIPYVRLRPDQQRIFEKMIFGSEENTGHVRTRAIPSAPQITEEGEVERDNGLQWQPTERYPNGLGAGSTVAFQRGRGMIIRAKGKLQGQYSTNSNMTVESLAGYLAARENPEATWAHETDYNEFTYLEERKMEYSFEGDPAYGVSCELTDLTALSKPVSSPDQLPEEVWAKIKEHVTALKAAQKNRKPPPARLR